MALVLLISCTVASRARSQALGQRTDFIFHVKVDPIYGDDAAALAQNPLGRNAASNGRAAALSRHKGLDNPTGAWPGHLIHAPYPFRTVTGALAFIANEFDVQSPAVGRVGYSWVDPDPPNKTYRMTRVVIHCLPGLYGAGTAIETRSGLRYNGESFPLNIPDGVCIQGTSALDTVFDAKGANTNLFQFQTGVSDQASHVHSFIDAITVRGARSAAPASNASYRNGIGIAILGEGYMQPVVSNCFITDNDVGIAIDAYPPAAGQEKWIHSPIIVNNTIVWNRIGIWSGQLRQYLPAGNANKGYSRPRILNNIIDSGDPNSHFVPAGQTSCFEGLDPGDLSIATAGTTILNLDFNAYEAGRYNRTLGASGITPPPGFGGIFLTAPRSASPSYAPRRDILPWTNTGTPNLRRPLYINETLALRLSVTPMEDSRSPHDFRLTMHPDKGNPALSPLTDLGIDLGLGALTFVNALTGTSSWKTPSITYAPGLKSPGAQQSGFDADFAPFHAWDYDCEGFGNWRAFDRPDVPDQAGFVRYSYLDLGADEMGELIIAGYIDRTRIFSESVPNTSGSNPPWNVEMLFINKWNAAGDPRYDRPLYTQWTGRSYDPAGTPVGPWWWNYVQAPSGSVMPNPGPSATSYYTKGMYLDVHVPPTTSTRLFLVTRPQAPYEPFQRNLECDFMPSLLPDIHPGWAQILGDVFGANPWFHHSGQASNVWDNKALYYLPSQGYAALEGHINPPGTTQWNGTSGFLIGTVSQFGPYSGGGATQYTVDSWGVGDAQGIDIAPSTAGAGVRMNCQVVPQTGLPLGNVQSFLIVVDTQVLESAQKGARKVPAPKASFRLSTKAQLQKRAQQLLESVKKSIMKK